MTGDWIDSIADQAGTDRQTVEQVHRRFQIAATPSVPSPAALHITRVAFTGTKVVAGRSEPIDFVWELEPGVWAVVTDGTNLKGKSTILEVVLWALRGRSHLQADVASWLSSIDVAFRLGDADWTVHIENVPGDLHGQITVGRGGVVATFESAAEFEAAAQDLMLRQLGLQPLAFFQRDPGADTGSLQSQGWPALSEALYVHSTDQVLGETNFGGLPGRLLQVYLGLPWASTFFAAQAAHGELSARTHAQASARGRESAAVAALRGDFEAARDRLAAMPDAAGAVAERVAAFADLAAAERELLENQEALAELDREVKAAQEAELEDERRLLDLRETTTLRRFFNGVEPRACPRCEVAVGSGRRRREAVDGHCSLCGEGLGEISTDGNADELERSLVAVRQGRASREQARDQFAAAAQAAAATLVAARIRATSLPSYDESRRRELELEVARLSGRLEEATEVRSADPDESETVRILLATRKTAEQMMKAGQEDLFNALNAEVLDLAYRFGMANLEAVKLDRAGHLAVTKGGVRAPYSSLTGGEQLRLKVAVVVGLFRIGEREHVGRHPGLLIVDAPGGHETNDSDLGAIVDGLASLADEMTAMQVIIATARAGIIRDLLPHEHVREADASGFLW